VGVETAAARAVRACRGGEIAALTVDFPPALAIEERVRARRGALCSAASAGVARAVAGNRAAASGS